MTEQLQSIKFASNISLYSSWRSSCSYRVRIYLNLKSLNYRIKPVDLIKLSSLNNAEVQLPSPTKFVPALEIDGHTLFESMAIMQYIEETRPHNPLLPNNPLKRAQVRAICDMIVSGIQPLQNTGVLNYIGDYLGEKEKKWSQHWIIKGFDAVEKVLRETSGKYCVGDEITLADCCLIPQVFNARRFHVDLKSYPIILRIDRHLHSHPAFRKAHPMMQDDFPSEMLTDPNFFKAKL
ncbi:CLUMA_CG002607, isoform A [Clunio marinus]|uniref:maleylacetoacetate isomerase n=1 Tax=Clunio marinus TaxID=568069 RepID=A0A1J1HP00_9DIPT|nr:CLUMA_CG002607, isoform A [Clunio marinus]